jgi:ribosome maturation factor RimP
MVRLAAKIEGTSKLKGVLETVDGERLTVLDEDRHRRYTVRFGDVKLARLVPEL